MMTVDVGGGGSEREPADEGVTEAGDSPQDELAAGTHDETIHLSSRPIGGVDAPRLWEFMWSESVIPRWFGAAPAGPIDGSLVRVESVTSSPRLGTLNLPGRGSDFTVALSLAPSDRGPTSQVTTCWIRVEDAGRQRVRIVIDESGFESQSQADAARHRWQEAIRQLGQDAASARRRDEHPRQAIVVFHGMGNQRPGETLTSLIEGGAIPRRDPADGAESGWVKPDRLSDSFELRSYSLASAPHLGRPRTDVYEAYWAHLVQGTTTSQVTGWALSVLRTWRHIPKQLAATLWLIRVLLLCALTLAVGVSADWITLPAWLTSGLVVIAAGAIWGLASKVYAGVLGDVARYLRPLPENIETRQRVRQIGVELLANLHEDGRYDRIVVLGHSLGSVVAYDVLTQLWIERHRRHAAPSRTRFTALRAVERAVTGAPPHRTGSPAKVTLPEARRLQHHAWAAMRANTQPWLVTDFVTVGSPLAHARTLLAKSPAAFAKAVSSRIYSTCPPVTETEQGSGLERITYDRGYRTPAGQVRTFTMFHHAAPFAVTRWTNLHFRQKWLGLKGDPISGEMNSAFGPWVQDVELDTAKWVWRAHTGYWAPGTTKDDAHLASLRAALNLEVAVELRAARQDQPLRLRTKRR